MEVFEGTQGYGAFTELVAWKAARQLKLDTYELMKQIPATNKVLRNQLQRAVSSIPANIAEGHGRFTFKDQIHFCIIARGSLTETCNHLIDAYDCKYIDKEALIRIKTQIDNVGKALNGYITHLRSRINQP